MWRKATMIVRKACERVSRGWRGQDQQRFFQSHLSHSGWPRTGTVEAFWPLDPCRPKIRFLFQLEDESHHKHHTYHGQGRRRTPLEATRGKSIRMVEPQQCQNARSQVEGYHSVVVIMVQLEAPSGGRSRAKENPTNSTTDGTRHGSL